MVPPQARLLTRVAFIRSHSNVAERIFVACAYGFQLARQQCLTLEQAFKRVRAHRYRGERDTGCPGLCDTGYPPRTKCFLNEFKRVEASCLPAGTCKPVGRKQVILVSFFLHDNRVLLSVRRGARKFGMEKITVVRAPSCSPSIVLISLSVSG